MSAEGWAAVASIVGFIFLALRQIFSTEFKLKNLTDEKIEGSVPSLSAKIKAMEAEKLALAQSALEDERARSDKAIEDERNRANAPITSTVLGQKVHDMANQMQTHYEHDDSRFAALTELCETMRKENNENFAELRKARGTRK